jgi:phospholipid/cholesterol/gamma-HCH transport system substrate-binding protein
VILIVIAGVALVIRAKIPSSKIAGGFLTYAKFRDGSRLAVGSPVVIAGVRVGVIEKLTVDGQLARIDMRLQDGLDLPVDSFATRRADSLFGDSYIEIIPAGGDEGAKTAQRMAPGDPIAHVVEGGSTDAILRATATALPKIDNTLDVVHDAVITGRRWVSGPLDDRLARGNDWLAQGHVEDPLEAADRAMVSIDGATARAADSLARAAPGVMDRLDRIDQAIVTARSKMGDVRTGLVDALHDTRSGIDRVDPQIAQATELMVAINEGNTSDWKGTLGRLVNDPALGNTLEDVTESGREAVASFNRFKTWLGMRIELDAYSRDVRFYATAEIRARADKFYLIELERGPLGGLPNDELSDAVGNADYTRRQTIADRVRFTAQFGKQLGRFSVRGGLKDSTFGFGVDALMFEGRLKLSTDLYGSFQATPRLKLTGALAVFRSLYVLAGIDDALNSPGYLPIVTGNPGAPKAFDQIRYGRDYFLGTTLVINDADISALLRVYGALLVGLL